MSVDFFKNFSLRRNEETENLSVGSIQSTIGVGYQMNTYFAENSNSTPNQENSGVNVGTSEEGQISEAFFGNAASCLSIKGELNPILTFFKSVKKGSILNRISISLDIGVKSEAIKGKLMEKDSNGNLVLAMLFTTIMSSLKYRFNLGLNFILIPKNLVKFGIGVNLLGLYNYGKSRMNKYGRFPVVELSGIVKTFKAIDFGLGFIFSDGTLFANLIFGLTKFKRFLVV